MSLTPSAEGIDAKQYPRDFCLQRVRDMVLVRRL